MARVVSIFNKKGGVGKTTLAINLARHLQFKLYEVTKDYLYTVYKDQRDFYDLLPSQVTSQTFVQNSIIDINENNNKLPSIIKASDTVIIPTQLDMKDILKTILSIQYVVKKNPTSRIVLAINRAEQLETDDQKENKKPSEYQHRDYLLKKIEKCTGLIFSAISTEFIDKYNRMNDINQYSVVIIRRNKIYFERSHEKYFFLNHFITNDVFIKVEQTNDFGNYFKNYSDTTIKDEKDKDEKDKDEKDKKNKKDEKEKKIHKANYNKILEIMFQYLFYYNPLYNKSRNKNPYNFNSNEIKKITSNFVKTDFEMLSLDEDFFDAMLFLQENWFFDINIDEQDEIKNSTPKDGEIFLKKEKFLYEGLKKILNFKNVHNNARAIKDMRILLCALGVYDV